MNKTRRRKGKARRRDKRLRWELENVAIENMSRSTKSLSMSDVQRLGFDVYVSEPKS